MPKTDINGYKMINLPIKTSSKEQLIDITDKVQSSIKDIKEGVCIVQTLHTTAGLTINENADPDVKDDILKGLEIFDNNHYKHSEGNSPAHIKSSLMGSSLNIIIKNNKLQLGTWQGIMFCEFDGPRNRQVSIQTIKNHS